MIEAIPTWAEVNCWVAMLLIGLAFIGYALAKGKRENERTITWMCDWDNTTKEGW